MTDYLNSSFDLDNPELVSAFDEVHLWSAPFGLKLLDTIKMRKNITVLDIGFGTGFPILEVALRLGTPARFMEYDPWKHAIERASFKMNQYISIMLNSLKEKLRIFHFLINPLI